MNLYWTREALILEREGKHLFLSRSTGETCSKSGIDVLTAQDCGTVKLYLGKIRCEREIGDETTYLLFVTSSTIVAHFRKNEVSYPIYRIDKVRAVPLGEDWVTYTEILQADEKSSSTKLKNGTDKLFKFVQGKLGSSSTEMLEELLKLFNDNPGFYYCYERDITHSTQSYFSDENQNSDERFFWNRNILMSLLTSSLTPEEKKIWCIPIVQGFVTSVALSLQEDPHVSAVLQLTLISRRSVNRAGTRYLRRGIDSDGNVANFVESELILTVFEHHLSFVQIRGSVPLFWSQKGYKYRPPLVIEKPISECLPISSMHFSSIIEKYGVPVVAVNLVDLTGRELQLAQNYMEMGLNLNTPDLLMVSFDLHNHCRGLKFDKINELVQALDDELNKIGFCWVDKIGNVVRKQNGVLRVNCVDCLDRTNVVEGVFSQFVCMKQAQRLGIFGPLSDPPEILVNVLQTMWADNGDAISTQYAGTAALKGDVTRCGERKLAGIVKDGYNSASRYYLSHIRDSVRQRAINLLLGLPDQGSESMAESETEAEEDESVFRLVNETIHFLIPEGEIVIGSWALISTRDGNTSEIVDTVVLLTRKRILAALYDEEAEKLIDVSIVPLDEVDLLELGRISRSPHVHLRVTTRNQTINECWIWRSGKARLFNSIPIHIRTPEEGNEYMESIAEQICVSYNTLTGKELTINRADRLTAISSQGTARKALSKMSSMLRMTTKRTVANKTKPEPSVEDSGTCTPQDDENSSAKAFRDDMNPSLEPPVEIHSSASDGRLVERSSIASRLRGLRQPFQKTSRPDPFVHLTALFVKSQTRSFCF